jgi:hypothetical protein
VKDHTASPAGSVGVFGSIRVSRGENRSGMTCGCARTCVSKGFSLNWLTDSDVVRHFPRAFANFGHPSRVALHHAPPHRQRGEGIIRHRGETNRTALSCGNVNPTRATGMAAGQLYR